MSAFHILPVDFSLDSWEEVLLEAPTYLLHFWNSVWRSVPRFHRLQGCAGGRFDAAQKRSNTMKKRYLDVILIYDSKSTEVRLAADRVIYSAEKKGYLCAVSTDMAVDMMEGQETAATVAAESAFYYYVIPTEAIVANNNGNASFYVLRQRETIMGTLYYAVQRTGYILEQNDRYVALSGAVMEPVIAFSDTPLADGQTVRIAETGA